jgi:hypothetical protein
MKIIYTEAAGDSEDHTWVEDRLSLTPRSLSSASEPAVLDEYSI